ncbi:hypothetical protein AADZ86_02860 [Colwelliaceae bacterium BS250]
MNPHLPEVVTLIGEAENALVGGTLVLRYGVASFFKLPTAIT